MRELRKRIVAHAHDHDAIATTGRPDQQVATGAAVWKSKGLSAEPLDLANNIFAADEPFGIAPLVERAVGTLDQSTLAWMIKESGVMLLPPTPQKNNLRVGTWARSRRVADEVQYRRAR